MKVILQALQTATAEKRSIEMRFQVNWSRRHPHKWKGNSQSLEMHARKPGGDGADVTCVVLAHYKWNAIVTLGSWFYSVGIVKLNLFAHSLLWIDSKRQKPIEEEDGIRPESSLIKIVGLLMITSQWLLSITCGNSSDENSCSSANLSVSKTNPHSDANAFQWKIRFSTEPKHMASTSSLFMNE